MEGERLEEGRTLLRIGIVQFQHCRKLILLHVEHVGLGYFQEMDLGGHEYGFIVKGRDQVVVDRTVL